MQKIMTFDSTHPLIKAVATAIAREQMLAHGDRVLVGVSGGADSVALLHILHRLSTRLKLFVGVAHLNHALRGKEADRDAAFVQMLARRLDLPCFSATQDVGRERRQKGGSIEAAGRRARYRFYRHTAKAEGFAKIALGHHADDNAEVVLMNILRGAGPGGLAGIPPIREPGIVRPLIHTWRHEIMAFIKDEGLAYVVDASNRDKRFLRNRIRHALMPELSAAYNPRLVESLVRIASIARAEEHWLEEQTNRMLKAAILERQAQQLALSGPYLAGLQMAPARRVVRGALKILQDDLHGFTLQHIDSIIDLALKGPENGERHLPGRLRIRKAGTRLLLTREDRPLRSLPRHREAAHPPDFYYDIPCPPTFPASIVIKEIGRTLVFSCLPDRNPPAATGGQNMAFIDMDKLDFPLAVRNVRSGDRFTPLGMQGSQKVKKFFINTKVARARRQTCPVLLSRERIVWLVGHRLDDGFKIEPSTRNILKVELLLA